eukprot:scaffold70233_cov63-Phaeocystis_antarctica.AAC.4
MFPSAEQFIISTGRTWCGGAHARRRRGGRGGGMPSTVLRATAGRNFFRNGCLAEGGCGVRAYCACACDTAAGRSSFRTGCFAEGGCGAEPRAVGPGLPVPGVRALLCPGPHGRAAGLPWTPAGLLCRLAEKLGLNPGCSLARRSPVPKLRSDAAARSGRFGCGSLTKPAVPVEERIARFSAGLARLSPTPCGCFGCGFVRGCFLPRGWAYSVLSFWSRANPSRLYSVMRELCRALASSRMTSSVSGCASPNILVRSSSVRRVSAKPSFFKGLPMAPTAMTSARTSIAVVTNGTRARQLFTVGSVPRGRELGARQPFATSWHAGST